MHDFLRGKNTGFNNRNLVINANLTKSNFIGFLFFCKWTKLAIFKFRNLVFFLEKVTYAEKSAENHKNKATNHALYKYS